MTLSKIFVVCVHTHNYHYDLENERKGELTRTRSESLLYFDTGSKPEVCGRSISAGSNLIKKKYFLL